MANSRAPRKGNSRSAGGKNVVSAQSGTGSTRLKDEIAAIVSVALGLFLCFAMFISAAGKLGAWISFFLKGCIGPIAYAFPVLLILYGVLMIPRKSLFRGYRQAILFAAICFMLDLIAAGFWLKSGDDPLGGLSFGQVYMSSGSGHGGGIIGMYVGALLIKGIGMSGLYIFSILCLLVALLLLINKPLSPLIAQMSAKAKTRRDERRESALKNDDIPTKEIREDFVRPANDNLKMSAPEPSAQTATTKNRKKIIEAVKNDELDVTGDVVSEGYAASGMLGMDGFGLDQEAVGLSQESRFGYGVDPIPETSPGFGLGDYDATQPAFQKKGTAVPFSEADLFSDIPAVSNDASSGGMAKGPGLPVSEQAVERFSQGDPLNNFSAAGRTPEAPPSAASGMNPSVAALEQVGRKKSADFHDDERLMNYKLPPVTLLNRGPKSENSENGKEIRFKAAKLEQTLKDFRVDAHVVNVTVGPTVTRYEVEPDVGVKIQSIRSLEPDLALKLEVKSVRVVPMPGQAVIGIEAYNSNTNLVSLRDIIDGPEFRLHPSKIGFALGKNISGERKIVNLAEMPHLLIAGTTGSGKSVCINSILLSILYRAKPDEVKMILVDPKVVELKSYNDIPHLLLPVVTDPERAATALSYAVSEMESRYRKFSDAGVRNLDGYNDLMHKEGAEDEVLPQIVLVIDELSDLMMVAPAKVQDAISRLAAMARAAGMHLIVATQQPLASILTSVIKANIPSRIAFAVSSNSASRVIMDRPGAERLFGKGDMLYSPVGAREPERIQGAFVSDSEVHKVTDFIKKQMDPHYSPDIMQAVSGINGGALVEEEDELFRDAVEAVVTAKQASVSMLQRRFRVGYNRAARLVDMMEERGIVAGSDGTNKPRKVLLTEGQYADWLALESGADDMGESPTGILPPGPTAGFEGEEQDMSRDQEAGELF